METKESTLKHWADCRCCALCTNVAGLECSVKGEKMEKPIYLGVMTTDRNCTWQPDGYYEFKGHPATRAKRARKGASRLSPALLSSKFMDWETPYSLYGPLLDEFRFSLDPCASSENCKCTRYFTVKEDGLKQSWRGERVFMNPPYGREIGSWVEKACKESGDTSTLVVCLVPARTDTRWFQDFCMKHGEVRYIRGRVKFTSNGKESESAPFPSAIVIFWPGHVNAGKQYAWEIPVHRPDPVRDKTRDKKLTDWLGGPATS